MSEFSCFIGIDQTGAAIRGGQGAKPLACAVLLRDRNLWRISVHRKLVSVSESEVEKLVEACSAEAERPLPPAKNRALIIDCVFGLPKSVTKAAAGKAGSSQAFWRVLRGTRASELLYGRKYSEQYFADLLRTCPIQAAARGDLPRRHCESLAKANSVFLTRPFQKNVQTGTFRIWRDLAESPRKWFSVWPFDLGARNDDLSWVFEGYPSLLWRSLLGLRTRDLKKLRLALETAIQSADIQLAIAKKDWLLAERDPDLADAVVLAVGGLLLQKKGQLLLPFPEFMRERRAFEEGWIIGLENS